MRVTVRAAFVPFTVAFEGGYITWMFPDVKGLVSTGFGLLLDPVAMALGMPWKRADGSLATREEIVADWANVKNHPNAARLGHLSVKNVAKLRLDNDGLFAAFQGKLNQNETVLRAGFPEWDEWGADAQLATLSMAWACGPAFYSPKAGRNYWPKLTAALREKDFRTAAVECFMNEEARNPGIIPRNSANRILYENAAVALGTLDPDVLFYPVALDRAHVSLAAVRAEVVPIIRPKVPLGRPALDDEPDPEAA